MAILICFASCDNGSTSGSPEKNPEELVSYELNGDAIKLYDDNTFVITLKENAGTISGTYSNLTSGHKLMVTKASGDIAKSGDILRLSVADGKVSVASSDITRYSTKDEGKVTEGTTPTTSSSGQGSEDSDKDYSLGDAPNGNRLSEKYFTFKDDCEDGIYFECDVPGGTSQFRVYIDGVGCVAEEIQCNDNRSKGYFFYPFLAPGKEYTIRCVFLREEDVDEDGWTLGSVYGNEAIGWFETKVTAGAKSKGEVKISDFGEIKVERNGDFTFTKKLAFENENLLTESGYDWILGIGLNEGVSWLHPNRRSKWLTEIDIPNKDLIGKTYNFYTYPRTYGDVTKVDFIVYRPKLFYNYKDKVYKYQWDGKTLDTDCMSHSELYTDIDVKNAAEVAKIKGTWIYKNEWNDTNYFHVKVHTVYTNTLEIDDINVKNIESRSYTKLDGSAFTIEELVAEKEWSWSKYENSSKEAAEFENELKENPKFLKLEKIEKQSFDDQISSYDYKIYYLNNNVSLSDDKKTLINELVYQAKLSEDYKDNYSSFSRHWDFKLFVDENTLKTIISGKNSDETKYNYTEDYKKQ